MYIDKELECRTPSSIRSYFSDWLRSIDGNEERNTQTIEGGRLQRRLTLRQRQRLLFDI